VPKIVGAIKEDVYSKRLFYNFWKEEFLAQNITGVCVSGCYFKVVDSHYLEMHVHSRANNAYSLLLLDMQFMVGFQNFIARKTQLVAGDYYHFFDSIHFFKKDLDAIHSQYDFILNSHRVVFK
jgi:thymidylate synthase